MNDQSRWFDEEGRLTLDDLVAQTDSFRRIMADGTITQQELQQQVERVNACLRELEPLLDQRAKAVTTRALVELAVLTALQHRQMLEMAR